MIGYLSYDPIVHLNIGPLSVSPHGIGILVGFLAGALVMRSQARRRCIPDVLLYALLTRAAIGAVVSARVAYVANHLGDFDSPLKWLAVWEGGISLLGGIVGAIVTALPSVRAAQLDPWSLGCRRARPRARHSHRPRRRPDRCRPPRQAHRVRARLRLPHRPHGVAVRRRRRRRRAPTGAL